MYLVTGATGFLGSHLLNALIAAGKPCKAIYRTENQLKNNKILSRDALSQTKWIKADLADFSLIADALQDVSRIYHVAALVSFSPSDYDKLMMVNVDLTARLVDLALACNVSDFIFVSSVAALGKDSDNMINEQTPWKNSALNSAYGISKFRAELEVWRGKEEGLNVAIVNPSVIIGVGDWHVGSCRLFKTVWNGLLFYPPGETAFVGVNDVVNAINCITDRNLWGQRFIVSSVNITYKKFFDILAQALDKPAPRFCPPRFLAEIGWRFLHVKGVVSGKMPLITKETTQSAYHVVRYDNRKLIQLTDFAYEPFEIVVKQTAAAFLNAHSTVVH